MRQLKKSGFFVVICLVVILYGCTTTHAPIESGESSVDANKIALLESNVYALEQELEKLKQHKATLERELQKSDNEKQVLSDRIKKLEERILFLESLKIEKDNTAYQDEIERLNRKEKELKETITRLEASLQNIYSDVVTDSGVKKTPQQIERETKLTVEKLRSQLDETTKNREHLQSQIAKQQSQIEVLINKVSESQTTAELNKSPLSLNKDDSNSPEIVEVYYGTNRQKLIVTWQDIFKPFILPILLLVLFFMLPKLYQLTLKEYLHRSVILTTKVILGAAFLFLAFAGVQSSIIAWQAKQSLIVQYGPDRMVENLEGLPFELGICHVSIPPTHQPGVVELPSLMYLELSVDPEKHFVMSDIRPHAKQEFFDKLSEKVEGSDDQDMFVFVHGFHNTFENAAFRTAQISYDMKFTGAPVFFSWPSQGNVVDYPTDESNAGAAVKDLRIFLEEIVKHSKAKKIHLIAHSMGNRVLTRAVKEMGLLPGKDSIFNEVVLAAPDMDAKTFKDIVSEMAKRVDRVTLYASSRDKALVVSNVLHGEYQRAGESKPHPVVVSPIESIDVSSVTDGHSYIADDGQILNDLNNIFKHSRVLNKEIAQPVTINHNDVFWVLGKPAK